MFEKELKAKGKQLAAGGSEAGYNSSAFHSPEAASLLLLRSRSNLAVSGMLYAIPPSRTARLDKVAKCVIGR